MKKKAEKLIHGYPAELWGEDAAKRAAKEMKKLSGFIGIKHPIGAPWWIAVVVPLDENKTAHGSPIYFFDFRRLYSDRRPLKGVHKRLRKAIRGKK